MKRHIEWFTGPDQTLKDRSRFWTWNMRGLHGDMDTRYEGDRRSSTHTGPAGRHLYTSSEPSGFNFRPLASNTYGYHPKGVSLHRRPEAGLAAQHALAHEMAPVVDNKRPSWSTSLKPLDDVMLMREPRSASVPPRRSMLPAGSSLRGMPIDPALDDLLNNRTWSETRTASPEELDEAEKALHKVKQIVGYCKPYDRHCHNAIGSIEDILRSVERNSGKAAMMASRFSPEMKSVTFDPRYID